MQNKKPTVLTNLQRGNVRKDCPNSPHKRSIHELAAQGELDGSEIHSPIDQEDDQGLTPLCWASAYGQQGAVEQLIKAGANPNHKSKAGKTALMFCSCKGYLKCVKILLINGADPNAVDDDGNSALIYASYEDKPWVVKELLMRGARLTCPNKKGQTPYSITLSRGNRAAQACIELHMLNIMVKPPNQAQPGSSKDQ